jgi:hypothetical protein
MADEPRIRGMSCGVQGCLVGAVALFVLLLVTVLIIAFFRFQEPPQGPRMPMSGVEAAPGGAPAASPFRTEASHV